MAKKTARMESKAGAGKLGAGGTATTKAVAGKQVSTGSVGSANKPTRSSRSGNIAVGKSAAGKVPGKKFTSGVGRPAAKSTKVGKLQGGLKAWDDDEFDGRRGKDTASEPAAPVPPEVVAQLRREAQQSLVQSVAVQWSVSVIVALIALAIGGWTAGLSALMGAACVTVPNSLLAFKLLMNSIRPDGGSGSTVLIGEFVKIGAVVLLLVLVVKLGGALIVWPALLAGLIAALKSYWVMLALGSIQRKGP